MTSRDDRRRQLERLTHRALRELPMLRAPATLEARVLSRIERRAGGSASHQGFAQWPLGARVALVASSVASLAFVLFGLNALWTRFIWLSMEPTVERRLEELRRGGEAIASLASVGLHLVRMIPAEWLLAGLLATALLYAMLIALVVIGYSTLYAASDGSGVRST